MSAHIVFLQGTYTLIHIPLDLYGIFLQPILRSLIPQTQSLHLDRHSTLGSDVEGLSDDCQHAFLNISVTVLECSIVCHTSWARNVFQPIIDALPPDKASTVSLCAEPYMVLSVNSDELDAATRVLDLTSPLAAAGIPIFFITTYYSDFILAPDSERPNVVDALYQRGFEISDSRGTLFTSRKDSSATFAPRHHQHERHHHQHEHQHHHYEHEFHDDDDDDDDKHHRRRYRQYSSPSPSSQHSSPRSSSLSSSPPPSPPLFSNAHLQSQTFRLMRDRGISPYLDPGLELISCSARDPPPFTHAYAQLASIGRQTSSLSRENWIEHIEPKFFVAVVSALLSQPRFASVTLTQADPPSVIIDKSLLPLFSNSVVCDMDSVLVPIFLDLVSLPSEVTGIVCVVSGRLVQTLEMKPTTALSYLSTARTGIVIVPQEQYHRALEILLPLLERRDDS